MKKSMKSKSQFGLLGALAVIVVTAFQLLQTTPAYAKRHVAIAGDEQLKEDILAGKGTNYGWFFLPAAGRVPATCIEQVNWSMWSVKSPKDQLSSSPNCQVEKAGPMSGMPGGIRIVCGRKSYFYGPTCKQGEAAHNR